MIGEFIVMVIVILLGVKVVVQESKKKDYDSLKAERIRKMLR